MVDLILRPSNLHATKPFALQLRWHESLGEVEYVTVAHVGPTMAHEIVMAGEPYWLFGEPEGPAPQRPHISALEKIAAERRRQIEVEGWTTDHDDQHRAGELALAASTYAALASAHIDGSKVIAHWAIKLWPFSSCWLKSKNSEADLVRAGALIVAELERLARAAVDTALLSTPANTPAPSSLGSSQGSDHTAQRSTPMDEAPSTASPMIPCLNPRKDGRHERKFAR